MRRAPLLPEPATRGVRGASGVCAALLVLTGCSASAVPAEPAASGPAPAQPAAEQVQEAGQETGFVLRARVTRVAGSLSDVRRERVARRARAVVEGYLAGAFAGEGDPFRSFTEELRRAARADRELVTGAGDVELRSARAWFSVAAPGGRPVGLTARLEVRLADGERVGSMTGRLLMTRVATRTGGEWRVFGYDLARSTGSGVRE